MGLSVHSAAGRVFRGLTARSRQHAENRSAGSIVEPGASFCVLSAACCLLR